MGRLEGSSLTAKKVFVSTPEMRPVETDEVLLRRKDTPEKRAAKALGVELVGLARDRTLSRTWRVKSPASEGESAMVIVAEGATPDDRAQLALMAEDLLAAGESLPGVLRPRAVAPSRDAYLTELLTAGSARDLAALKWSPRRRVELVLKAARALEGLHALGIVHACLCPANILLDDALSPVLAEVGAVPVHALAARGADATLYSGSAAPEVNQGAVPDVRSDVYSLGRVLEEAVKGDEPNVALGTVIRKSTAKDPANRYGSVASVAAAIEAMIDQLSTVDAPAEPAAQPAPRTAERPARTEEPRTVAPQAQAHTPSTVWLPPSSSASSAPSPSRRRSPFPRSREGRAPECEAPRRSRCSPGARC